MPRRLTIAALCLGLAGLGVLALRGGPPGAAGPDPSGAQPASPGAPAPDPRHVLARMAAAGLRSHTVETTALPGIDAPGLRAWGRGWEVEVYAPRSRHGRELLRRAVGIARARAGAGAPALVEADGALVLVWAEPQPGAVERALQGPP
jgi:hypothetical protein